MKKKLLAAACLFLAIAAVSCTSETPEKPSDSSESPSSANEPETDPKYDIPEPELPDLDLTGQKYTYYNRVDLDSEDPNDENNLKTRDFLWVDGLVGEVVRDSVFNRNLKIEQKFGCKVELLISDNAPDMLILAGDSSFDLVCGSAVAFGDAMYTGAYMNFGDLPYCNLDSEYWSPSCVRDTVFKGKLYMMANDNCMSPLSTTGFLYFNKRILAENDLESPYQMVYDNTWTIDNFLTMIRQVHGDMNGDGIMNEEDLYGALVKAQFRMGCFLQFYFGSGKTLTREDPDAGRVIDVDGEFCQLLIDKLYPVLEDKTVCLNNLNVRDMTGDDKAYQNMFLEGHSLFIQEEIAAMDLFRNMEDDYGIVPNPKYDTTQTDYYHRVFPHASVFALPVTTPDLEKTGAVTEYSAWLSHYTVLPAYYEITVKQKRTRDEDAINMLDIIRKSMVFEFGDVYDSWMPNYLWDSYVDKSFSRKFGASIKVLTKRLKKYTQTLDNLD